MVVVFFGNMIARCLSLHLYSSLKSKYFWQCLLHEQSVKQIKVVKLLVTDSYMGGGRKQMSLT